MIADASFPALENRKQPLNRYRIGRLRLPCTFRLTFQVPRVPPRKALTHRRVPKPTPRSKSTRRRCAISITSSNPVRPRIHLNKSRSTTRRRAGKYCCWIGASWAAKRGRACRSAPERDNWIDRRTRYLRFGLGVHRSFDCLNARSFGLCLLRAS